MPHEVTARQIVNSRELSPVELYQRNAGSVFKIVAMIQGSKNFSQGSAVAIAVDKVITNCHVTKGYNSFGIVRSGEVNLMDIYKSNAAADICIYITEKEVYPIVGYRDYESLQVGEKVYAIGSPEGFENTLSEGIISALRLDGKIRKIQFTAPMTHGSSGGALFDGQGRLIGITTEFYGERADLNFAVSIDEAL